MYNHQCTFNLTITSQDREARLDLMRKRARERDGDFDGEVEEPATKKKPRLSPDAPPMTERGHINFFADIKQGVGYGVILPIPAAVKKILGLYRDF